MNSSVKVIHVTQTAGSNGGGVARYISDLTSWQRSVGLDVSTVSCDQGRRRDEAENVVVLKRKWPNFLGNTSIIAYLSQLEQRPDVIHIHGLRCLHNFRAAAWAFKHDIPVVVTPHGQLMPGTMRQRRWKKLIYDTLVERRVLARASMIHFVSENEREESLYGELYRGRDEVATIGLNQENWNSLPVRPLSQIDLQRPVITYFARLSIHKGLDLIIDAMPALLAARPDLQLMIAGSDPDGIRPFLLCRAMDLGVASSITWLCPIERAEARWLVAHSDVFLLPSRSEGFPIGLLEALSLGTQVVATHEAAWRNLAERGYGENCQLSSDSVAASVLKVLSIQKATRQARRCKIATEICEEYTWNRCGSLISDIYRRLGVSVDDVRI